MKPDLLSNGRSVGPGRLAATVLCVWAMVAVSVARPAVGDPAPGGSGTTVHAAHISPALDQVRVSSPSFRRATAALDSLGAQLHSETSQLDSSNVQLMELTAQAKRLDDAIARNTAIKARADRQIASLRTQLRRLALQAYVGSEDRTSADAAAIFDGDAALANRTSVTLRDAVTGTANAHYRTQLAVSNATGRRLLKDRATAARVATDLEGVDARIASLHEAIDRDNARLPAATALVAQTRATAFVDGTDLPLVALDAYVHATSMAALMRPGCHVGWSLLAGIGEVESGQGSYGGTEVRADGTLTQPIYGIPLDGTGGNETIVAADGSYMRAEGPMQFLPSTWAAVGVDGDGDGVADIQNLYDAAATAAMYLCRNGVDVATAAGLRSAILSYNFSGAYFASVTAAAKGYAEALPDVPGA
ncbi:MAG: lytic murein transglycosylase [Actinobacteria bacterium]|nr:lytic murein transglycosylase [Actinomycetota bacterium]